MQMLVEEKDCLDNHLMIWPKDQGGTRELQDYIRRLDSIREAGNFSQLAWKQSRKVEDLKSYTHKDRRSCDSLYTAQRPSIWPSRGI